MDIKLYIFQFEQVPEGWISHKQCVLICSLEISILVESKHPQFLYFFEYPRIFGQLSWHSPTCAQLKIPVATCQVRNKHCHVFCPFPDPICRWSLHNLWRGSHWKARLGILGNQSILAYNKLITCFHEFYEYRTRATITRSWLETALEH